MSTSTGLNLSQNAIKSLFELPTGDKKTYEVNLTLQVINLRKCEQNRKGSSCEMFTATLSDSKMKYNGFIIFKNEESENLEETDIILMSQVTPAVINNQKSRVFIVKKYKLISKAAEILGDPELVKDEDREDRLIVENLNSINNREINNNNQINQNLVNNQNFQSPSSIPTATKIRGGSTNTTNFNSNIKINSDEEKEEEDFTKRGSIRGKYYTPLNLLTTFSKDFQILIRVIKKSEMKTFNSSPNKNGGTLFSFNVLDEKGNEMQVTCFNKAVDKFYNLIKEDQVFEITGGYVKINNQKFTSIKSEYKIVIDENSQVVSMEDDGCILHQKYTFVRINKLATVPLYSVVDLIGYVLDVGELQIKHTKNGDAPMKKIMIADTSDNKIELTLWRVFAHREVSAGQIVALKNVKVGEFNGRNITTFEDSGVLVDPIMKEASELKNHMLNKQKEDFDQFKNVSLPTEKVHNENSTLSQVYNIKDVLDSIDDVINDDKLPISRIKATVTQMMHNDKNFYGGCEDLKCKKKLTKETYNWSCLSCNKSYEKPTYYYTLSIRVKDCSSEHWIDIFGNVAEKLIKISAEDYKDLLLERDQNKLKEITNLIEFKTFYFHVKPKLHFYNSVPKKKLYAYKIEVVDPIIESKRLIKMVNSHLKE